MPYPQIPKAIIFDWDNTLVDTWPLIHNALNNTMIQMGEKPWSLETVKNNTHKSMKDYFPKLFGKNWQKAGETYSSTYKSSNLEKIRLLSKATELIDKLYKLNITLMVISNKVGHVLRQEAEKLGIKDKFFAIIGSTDAKYDKPHKEVVDLALKGSGLNPNNDLIWFIGDTIADIQCAYNSKCQPILYGELINIPSNIIENIKNDKDKPLLHFENHQEILEYIALWK